MSHDYSEQTLNWPTSEPFHVTNTIVMTDQFYVSARDYASNEHAGTHLDAPNHFAKGHHGISEISLNNLIGQAIKVDVSNPVKLNRDYLVTIDDFKNWEKVNGKIPNHTIILLNTGFGHYWSNKEKYAGTKEVGEKSLGELHFPGLDPKAALWLIQQRKVKAIGIDTFSIDFGHSKKHRGQTPISSFKLHPFRLGCTVFYSIASKIRVW